MAEDYSRGNQKLTIVLDEKTTAPGLMLQVKNAFIEGITCFEFKLTVRGREFCDRVALRPEIHDESDAIELGATMYARMMSAVRKVIR